MPVESMHTASTHVTVSSCTFIPLSLEHTHPDTRRCTYRCLLLLTLLRNASILCSFCGHEVMIQIVFFNMHLAWNQRNILNSSRYSLGRITWINFDLLIEVTCYTLPHYRLTLMVMTEKLSIPFRRTGTIAVVGKFVIVIIRTVFVWTGDYVRWSFTPSLQIP